MKILFSHYAILDQEGFGRTFMLARELALLGHSVTFLTSQHSNINHYLFHKENRENVSIYSFPDIVPNSFRRTGFGIFNFVFKLFFIVFTNYDIYFSDNGHRLSGGIPILIRKIFFRTIYISEWWDYFGKNGQFEKKKGLKKISHGFYDLFFEEFEKKRAEGIVCLSAAMFERAKNLNVKKQSICIIHGGADVRAIKFYSAPINQLKQNESAELILGFVGLNLGELNDILPLIMALNEITKDKSIPYPITLLSTGKILPKEVTDQLNIRFNFVQMGWTDYRNYPELLAMFDIAVLTQEENLLNLYRWPNKIGDYLAAGRKILINSYGETSLFVSEFQKVFIEVNFDIDSIKNKIIEVYNSKFYKQDRFEIRRIACENFSWQLRAKELEDFIYEVIQKNKRTHSRRKLTE